MAVDQQFIDIERKLHSRRPSSEARGADAACSCGRDGAAVAVPAGVWRAAAAEALGSALLVLFSCLPAALGAPSTHAALAAGAVVTMLVQCFDHLSYAMFNPAVALAGAVMGRISWRRGAVYLPAQLAGAAAGARALAALAGAAPACGPCVTLPAAGLGAARAAALEGALTAALALANCAAWDVRTRANADSWPLRIGATVAALSLAAGLATGASMNPARSFGPALCAGAWQDHWVYWVGPLGGSLAAALLYRAAWSVPAPRAAAPPRGDDAPH